MPEEQSKVRIDWKKKGLGWIPDYPDLRDYQLNDDRKEIIKGSRLKTEESTNTIEDLVEEFLKTLGFFTRSSDIELAPLRFQAERLQQRFFGNLEFRTVKVYKLLRRMTDTSFFIDKFPLNKVSYESDLSKQIVELKNYLYVLRSKQYLSTIDVLDQPRQSTTKPSTSPRTLAKDIFSNPTQIAKWLRDQTFDEPTEELVMLFQCCAEIEIDGLVGLETYTTLNNYFNGTEDLKTLKDKHEECLQTCKGLLQGGKAQQLEYTPKIRLISIPSLIPTGVFKKIFNAFISVGKEEIRHEYQDMRCEYQTASDAQVSDHIFETAFLQQIGISPSVFRDLVDPNFWMKSPLNQESPTEPISPTESISPTEPISPIQPEREPQQEETTEQTFIDAIQDGLKVCNLNTESIENFIEVFQNEFLMIEPIVSMVMKILSPLACYNDQPLEKVIEVALDDIALAFFEAAYSDESTSKDFSKRKSRIETIVEKLADLEKKDELFILEELSKAALAKVVQYFDDIKWIIKDNEWVKDDDEFPDGTLYQRLKEINRRCEIAYKDYEKIKKTKNAKQKRITDQQNKIRSIEAKKRKYELFACTLWFCFFLKKFLNRFVSLEQQNKLLQQRAPNIFDKQDLFEIVISDSEFSDELNAQIVEDSEIFSVPKLSIPFSRKLIKTFKEQNLKENTCYRKPFVFLPGVVDLSLWCPEIEDQGQLNACSAFAAVALVEYFTNRSLGQHVDVSPLFLYKAARNLMNLTGDVGASLRETMKALALFGVPPEEAWPYDMARVDEEPPPFCYAYAQNYQAIKYFRLDYAGISRDLLLLSGAEISGGLNMRR